MNTLNNIDQLNQILSETDTLSALRWLSENPDYRPVFSTSFGQEDQVLTDLIFRNNLDIDLFTLDTGRLFPETHVVMNETLEKYGKKIDVYYPVKESVDKMVNEKGLYSFYESVENRKECCGIRKLEPLERALKPYNIWVTGLRAGQSENRQNFQKFQYDLKFGTIKFNPLLHWSLNEIEEYLIEHQVPQNILHSKGYVSIGCEPCTRAIRPGEDIRAGRWWWEEASKKECGLHAAS